MKLIIDRAKWLRGEGSGQSFLLRVKDEKMCCLGFYGTACGMASVELRGYGTPHESPDAQAWPDWLIENDDNDHACASPASRALMGLNDSTTLDDATRESQIAAEFARHGVEVEFV